jgi:hypothetical protein
MKEVIFLVTWVVVTHIPTACPDAKKENEYGFDSGVKSFCAVYHFKIKKQKKQKEFNTEAEADEFIKNMPIVEFGEGCKDPKKYKVTKDSSSHVARAQQKME